MMIHKFFKVSSPLSLQYLLSMIIDCNDTWLAWLVNISIHQSAESTGELANQMLYNRGVSNEWYRDSTDKQLRTQITEVSLSTNSHKPIDYRGILEQLVWLSTNWFQRYVVLSYPMIGMHFRRWLWPGTSCLIDELGLATYQLLDDRRRCYHVELTGSYSSQAMLWEYANDVEHMCS